jgi:hypothetical protein
MNQENEVQGLEKNAAGHAERGPKYHVVIDGKEYPWGSSQITVPQLRVLGGIPAGEQMMLIDENNSERPLREDEVIELKPGQGFAKKVRFKRG